MEQLQSLVLNPLKPLLLPITTNLPGPLDDFALSLLGQQCHKRLVHNLDITTNPECLSLAISKALGIAIVTTASIVKVPQIIKLIRSQSAEGLSFTSYLLETTSFLITLAYNIRSGFPFSTYGETCFLVIQDVIIAVLILTYTRRAGLAGALVAGVAATIYALIIDNTLITPEQMTTLQAGAGLLGIASKIPQITAVYAQGGTGQLSAFAVFNYLLGSLSRIFTTLQEVDDNLILYGFVAGFILNATLASQMVYYWNSPVTAAHAGGVGEKKKAGVLQGGVQGVATDENIKRQTASSTATATGTASPRPTSSSGRRRG